MNLSNSNQNLLDGIKREVKEETNIILDDEQIKFYKIYDDPSRIIAYSDGNVIRLISVSYIANLKFKPQLILSEESRELRFFSKNEIASLNIVKTHQQILEDYLAEKN